MKQPCFRYGLLTCTSLIMMACGGLDSRIEHKDSLLKNAMRHSESQVFLNSTPPIYHRLIRADINAQSATIYIEGDGFAYVAKSKPSRNPTPKNPIALELAVADNRAGQNIYYIARPCQYIQGSDFQNQCPQKYWTTHRYAKDVLESFNSILNHIKSETNITQFNLVGFSGGGNIAGILAADRNDITSIRTVAGNLDNDFFTRYHRVSDMPYSLNMADYAARLSTIPQIHFIADDDEFVPRDISHSYEEKLPDTSCAQFFTTADTTHLNGWAERWPELLQKTPQCQ